MVYLLTRHPGLVPGSTVPRALSQEPLVLPLPPGGPRDKPAVATVARPGTEELS